jgi:putative ABC transport system substrate-binding protein
VDVIVATGGAIPAAKQATSVIPIVFPVAGDPVSGGYVDSLARPGGNITGLSLQQTDVASKRVGLLREAVAGLRRLAIMANVGNSNAVLELGGAHAAARTLGLEVATFEFRRSEDIVPAFDALNGRVDAIYVCGDALVFPKQNNVKASVTDIGLTRKLIQAACFSAIAGGISEKRLQRHAMTRADLIAWQSASILLIVTALL